MNERQKAANSYARMFAAQKEKKAKDNEGKNAQNGDTNQGRGAIEHLNSQVHPQMHIDATGYGGHPGVGWPVDTSIHPSYDPALGMYSLCRELEFVVIVVVVLYICCCMLFCPCLEKHINERRRRSRSVKL